MKRKTDNFSKFYNKKSNAAIKEEFRQEKKAAKRERKAAIERHFEEKRKARTQQETGRPAKPAITRGPKLPAGPAKPASPGMPTAKPAIAKPAKQASPGAPPTGEQLPLNKYIAHGGLCSRRDAADLIRQGKVTVNGQLITEPGTKVTPADVVKVNGKKVTISHNFVYILLNKPKDYITTTDDPQGRRTVLDLIRNATTERVFPIGRLDRNTSGVLLLTNDGDLAQKLAHPSHEIKKIYHVVLDKPLTKADFDKIIAGDITLEDGPAQVDVLAYADPKDKTQIGLEIHSGRNRIVRRIFEHLGYDVRGLDRVMYAGLTKKNVQRGHWRLLTEKEIRILKYLNSSFRGSLAPAKPAPTNVKAAVASTKAAPAGPESHAKRPSGPGVQAPGKRPTPSIPPKGRKPAAPPKGRKPYNPKSPRPESD
ncbi:pseudouridine synthase [Puia dinghuensis]|nr:pseudouridine synthase [Puia dinghuensis]